MCRFRFAPVVHAPLGDAGGEIVAAGTPEKIAATKKSYAGQFLAPVLARGAREGRRGKWRRSERFLTVTQKLGAW